MNRRPRRGDCTALVAAMNFSASIRSVREWADMEPASVDALRGDSAAVWIRSSDVVSSMPQFSRRAESREIATNGILARGAWNVAHLQLFSRGREMIPLYGADDCSAVAAYLLAMHGPGPAWLCVQGRKETPVALPAL